MKDQLDELIESEEYLQMDGGHIVGKGAARLLDINIDDRKTMTDTKKTVEPEEKSIALLERRPTSVETDSACMYIRHDYGLMGPIERQELRSKATEWLRAWRKVQEDNERSKEKPNTKMNSEGLK